ncbi:MAG: glycine radical domain-containing protein [Blautia faecis]
MLTITSNVVWPLELFRWKKEGEPSLGANLSYGAEQNGLFASLNSVAKLDYEDARMEFPIQTINPEALGHSDEERTDNRYMYGRIFQPGCISPERKCIWQRETDRAMEHPERGVCKLHYPCFRLCS